ncbi:MAG: PstS family phosphate ABC transporter substrate-binding protein [Verrucomicrobiota bacterium]
MRGIYYYPVLRQLALIALTICCLSSTWAGDKIVVKGSDTLGAKLMPRLKEAFKAKKMAEGEAVTFEIAAEGSRTGIMAIIEQKADLAMSSREVQLHELLKARQSGVQLEQIPVGVDGIAIIVNENNPLDDLSRREVEMIFTGDIDDWSALAPISGRISAYTRNTSSGTYSLFQDVALHERDYTRLAQKLAGNEQIASEVASNPYAIGYVGLAYSHNPGLKVLKVDGKLPTDRGYPYARPLYFYIDVKKDRCAMVDEFIAFTLSADGQAVVESVDFLPVSRIQDVFPGIAGD